MNPFLQPSTLPFQTPTFDAIQFEHFKPAFEEGLQQHKQQIQQIAEQKSLPNFENTILALESSGEVLQRVSQVFFNLCATDSNESLQSLQTEMAPKLAEHDDFIYLHQQLFDRVADIYEHQLQELDSDAQKLVEDIYKRFIRAGAQLNAAQQDRIRAINQRISSLQTDFEQKLLQMLQDRFVVVDKESDLAGLSSAQIAQAKKAAKERNLANKWVLQITNTTRSPLLERLEDREVRKKLWECSALRGQGLNGDVDTRPIILELARLRAEKASILGYENYAALSLDSQMAKKPENVRKMLFDLAQGVSKNSALEAQAIEKQMKADGIEDELKTWDWLYYAEKVKASTSAVDDSLVKPFFELNSVVHNGVFHTMNLLYGIHFEERNDIPTYHEDVRTYEVFNEQQESIGLFFTDYFARASKRGGAWMSTFVDQAELLHQKPVVVNVMNIAKTDKGEPTLLSLDEVQTLFHEMGHGVHGLLSKVRYPSQSGTSVPTDFVEFPSTFQEDWAIDPAILSNYAKHYETGETIPEDMLKSVIQASQFNQGFDTQEYLAAAILDLEWHSLGMDEIPTDIEAFEQEVLSKYGLKNPAIPPRYKSTYFAHIFTVGYAARYYAYIWSEVLAADAFAYMREKGGAKAENGKPMQEWILSKGGSAEPMHLYRSCFGREPNPKYLLIRRGLAAKS